MIVNLRLLLLLIMINSCAYTNPLIKDNDYNYTYAPIVYMPLRVTFCFRGDYLEGITMFNKEIMGNC